MDIDPQSPRVKLESSSKPYADKPAPLDQLSHSSSINNHPLPDSTAKARSRKGDLAADASKRRCCDGNTPACAACSSVYGTECIYDPNSDHRRKGVYKQDIDNLKTRNSTLQTLIQAILNWPPDEVPELVSQIRNCESLDDVAELISERGIDIDEQPGLVDVSLAPKRQDSDASFEAQLASKLGELRLDNGRKRFIGGTSNLLYGGGPDDSSGVPSPEEAYDQSEVPATTWTTVTSDPDLIMHLLTMYFTWHYTFFTTLSKKLFFHDFQQGMPPKGTGKNKVQYCTPLLLNTMLALGCHFSSRPEARSDPDDAATAGDHFFAEAKRLFSQEEEYAHPKLATVQATALMSVREAGCGREEKGWAFSGVSFRMACDLGLNVDSTGLSKQSSPPDDLEEDARRMTFWGCFLFDKCWSNYLGRLPQFILSQNVTVPKFEVYPEEDASEWAPYTDAGFNEVHSQPSRTRAVALQISSLCEINSDLMKYFYHPQIVHHPPSKKAELKRLSEIHGRLETWRRELPAEFEAKEGALSSVLHMHMMFQILYIHLFRRFLNYDPNNSPLPANVSPRKQCTSAAATISKLFRIYKRSYGLRQICNIAVYIAHSACTIHLLNLPDKNAKRDITHGVKQLEEIAEGWLCARRTLRVLSYQVRKWKVELPDEASVVLARTDAKFGPISKRRGSSPHASINQQRIPQEPQPLASIDEEPWDQSLDFSQFDTGFNFTQPFAMSPDDAAAAALAGQVSQPQQAQASMSRINTNELPSQPGSFPSSATASFMPDPSSTLDAFMTAPTTQNNSSSSSPVSSHARHPQPFSQHNSASHSPQSRVPPPYTKAPMASIPPGSTAPPFAFQKPAPNPSAFYTAQQQAQQQSGFPTSFTQPPHQSMQPHPAQQQQLKPQQGRVSMQQQPQPQQQQQTAKDAAGRPDPSDRMFGGVQQLLQDSEQAWFKDQQQVASGFGKWE